MITHIDKTGVKLALDDDIKKYIDRKIGSLDKYLPRQLRKDTRAEVKLREANNTLGNKYVCEVILHIPGSEPILAKEATLNMFAAIDIVEAKLKNQLHELKELYVAEAHGGRGLLRRVFGRKK